MATRQLDVHRVIIYMDAAPHRRVARIQDHRAVIAAHIAPHRPRHTHRHIRTRPAQYRAIVRMLSLVVLAVVVAPPRRRVVHAACSPVLQLPVSSQRTVGQINKYTSKHSLTNY